MWFVSETENRQGNWKYQQDNRKHNFLNRQKITDRNRATVKFSVSSSGSVLQRERTITWDPSYTHGECLVHATTMPPVMPISARHRPSNSGTIYIWRQVSASMCCNEKKIWQDNISLHVFIVLKEVTFKCAPNFIKDEQLEYNLTFSHDENMLQWESMEKNKHHVQHLILRQATSESEFPWHSKKPRGDSHYHTNFNHGREHQRLWDNWRWYLALCQC